MKTIPVKEIMVPLSEYATVPEDATLFEAVIALGEARVKHAKSLYSHKTVLVFNSENRIVGKIGQVDILRALEPKYMKIIDSGSLSRFGYTTQFLKSLVDQYQLWDKPLNDICQKAVKLKVNTFMVTPADGEYISENSSLDEAIHMLVMGNHQSLFVKKENEITGILRLTDLFDKVSESIKLCGL
ncbi:MAG: CBS domain-containing protein [Desulfobacterales bacterium]